MTEANFPSNMQCVCVLSTTVCYSGSDLLWLGRSAHFYRSRLERFGDLGTIVTSASNVNCYV